MKKFRRCAVVVLALAMTMMMSISSFAYTNVIGKSGSKGANIREHATTKSDVVGSIAPNTEFTICGEVKDSAGMTWYFVFVDSKQTGYIRSDIVTNTGVPAGGETSDSATDSGSGNTTTTPDTEKEDPVTPNPPVDEPVVTPSDCTLSSIIFQDGFLEPEFEPEVYEYTLTVDNEITSVAVSANTTDPTSSIEGSLGFDNLEVGINDRYITVKGADGNTAVYHFSVVRSEADSAQGTQTPDQSGDADTDTKDTTDKTVKKSSGVSKIVVVLLVIVIVGLMVVIVFMALQMRDMREEIEMLEREKRRRKKKAQEAHRIASGNEKDGKRNNDNGEVRREVTSVKPSGPAFEKPVKLNIQPEMVPPHKRDLRITPEIEPIKEEIPMEISEEPVTEEYVQEFPEIQYVEPQFEEEAFSIQPSNVDMAEASQTEEYTQEEYIQEEYQQEEEQVEETDNTEELTAKVIEEDNDSWKSVNFLAPEDDMEFEFLDLDDDKMS